MNHGTSLGYVLVAAKMTQVDVMAVDWATMGKEDRLHLLPSRAWKELVGSSTASAAPRRW